MKVLKEKVSLLPREYTLMKNDIYRKYDQIERFFQ